MNEFTEVVLVITGVFGSFGVFIIWLGLTGKNKKEAQKTMPSSVDGKREGP